MSWLAPREREVAELIACYDFRLETDLIARRLHASVNYVRQILRKLREKGLDLWPQHIRDLRPLGLHTVVVHSDKPLGEIRMMRDLVGKVPLYRYLYSYRTTLDNQHVYSYLAPREFLGEFLDELGRLGEPEPGITMPVYPCRDIAARIRGLPEDYKPSLLDLLLYAVLDREPLASLQDLTDINIVYWERLDKRIPGHRLSYSKLYKAYRRLSEAGVIGRVLLLAVPRLNNPRIVPLYIRVRQECYTELYDVVATTRSSPSIFVGKETAATVMVLGDDETEIVRRKLGSCIVYSGVITTGFGVIIPVEMYNPVEKRWGLEPMPLPELVQRLGLLAR